MMTNNSRNIASKPSAARRQPAPQKAPEPAGYFDLHTKGCGYMNRIRWVTPKANGRKAEEFLACSINALHGKITDPQYSYMDLRVSGEDAINLVSELIEDSEASRKIFVAFTVGDIYAHTYWRDIKEQGRKTGEQEPAAIIKGRLLLITHIAIDDVVVYHRYSDELGDETDANAETVDHGNGDPNDDQFGDEQGPQGLPAPTMPAARDVQKPARKSAQASPVGQPVRHGSELMFRGRPGA
jgi:hypothetical protein